MCNGGFEESWNGSHRCMVIDRNGNIIYRDIGNIFTPPAWIPWFYHEPEANPNASWDQPEIHEMHKSNNPERVHTGEQSMVLFTFYRRHDAGFLQQISVVPGNKYKASAYAHAWSNHKDGPHPDDPRWSEGAGYDGAFWLEGTQPPNGDPQQDAKSNFTFYVGVDPTGNVDPTASTVVWGMGVHIYNKYAQVPEVEFTAQGDTATIFLHSRTRWAFKHNDAYWDTVALNEVVMPYESTILVLPQDATREQLTEILDLAYPRRRTFGFSHDDAGTLANATNGTVILYNIADSDKEDYLSYYIANYPKATIKWAYTSDYQEPNKWTKFLLWQCHPDWKDRGFGAASCTGTICTLGCYITNLAMAQRIYGINQDATPITIDAALGATGYSGCNALWSAIETKCGITITDKGDLNAHLDAGGVAMIEVLPAGYQHFVLAVEARGEDYLILDPWYNEVALLSKRYPGVESYRLLNRHTVVEKKTRGYVGLHLQGNASGVTEFVHDVKPAIMKCATGFERVIDIKANSPNTTVILRHVDNNYGGILDNPDPLVGARRWIAKFSDSLKNICASMDGMGYTEPYFYVESINEVYPSLNAAAVTQAANFDRAFIKALAELNLPIGPAVFTAAVGNPHETEFELLIPLARDCMNAGGLMGYHNYWPRNLTAGGPTALWKYLAGRWAEMDKVFVANNIFVKWYGGESGAVGGEWGEGWVYLKPNDGWKSRECMNGNWSLYLQEIMEMDELVAKWGDRYVGFVLFTTSGPGWASFDIGTNEIRDIGKALITRYPTIRS